MSSYEKYEGSNYIFQVCVCVKKEGFQNMIFDDNLDTCMGFLSDSFSRRQGSPTVWSAVSSHFITREHFLTHRLQPHRFAPCHLSTPWALPSWGHCHSCFMQQQQSSAMLSKYLKASAGPSTSRQKPFLLVFPFPKWLCLPNMTSLFNVHLLHTTSMRFFF